MLNTLTWHDNNNLDPIDLRILLSIAYYPRSPKLLWIDRLCISKEVDGWHDVSKITERARRADGLVIREGWHYLTTFDGQIVRDEDEVSDYCEGELAQQLDL